jgi:hypothetical protein
VTKIGNLTCTTNNITHYEIFSGIISKLTPAHMVEFARIGYDTYHQKIRGKNKPNSRPCLMVGCAEDHNHDTYQMFDSSTKEVILSRDVEWDEWKRSDPASSLQLILHKGTPLRTGEDKIGAEDNIGQVIDEMDIIAIQMTGNSYYEEVVNDHTLITDDEESGSGRMGALPYKSDDEDDNFNGLWGLPPGFPELHREYLHREYRVC